MNIPELPTGGIQEPSKHSMLVAVVTEDATISAEIEQIDHTLVHHLSKHIFHALVDLIHESLTRIHQIAEYLTERLSSPKDLPRALHVFARIGKIKNGRHTAFAIT